MKRLILRRVCGLMVVGMLLLSACGKPLTSMDSDPISFGEDGLSQPPTAQGAPSVPLGSETATSQERADSSAPTAITPTGEMLQTIRLEFQRLVNEERRANGRDPLILNDTITEATNIRAKECFELFEHTRPNGTGFETVLQEVGYRYRMAGENICYTSNYGDNYVTPEHIFVGSSEQLTEVAEILFTSFKNSPPHYENMLVEEFQEHGIGLDTRVDHEKNIVYFTCCHLFGTPLTP